jgi:pimeloyl-ACP methyl ester carboxylesterase
MALRFRSESVPGRSTPRRATLLLIHGWLHSPALWRQVIDVLEERFDVCAPAVPGFAGAPPLPPDGTDPADQVVRHLCDEGRRELDTQCFEVVVGDSLGALLALRAAAHDRSLCRPLVLIGPPVNGLPWPYRFAGVPGVAQAALAVAAWLPRPWTVSATRRMARPLVRHLEMVDDVYVDAALSADRKAAGTWARRIARRSIALPLRAPPPACLVVRGQHDPLLSGAAAERLATSLRGHYVELDGDAHSPHLDSPEALMRAIVASAPHTGPQPEFD